MKYNRHSICSLMQQMFIVSDCLLRLGYRKLALQAQQSQYWEFVCDYVALIVQEARRRQDDDILDKLARADLIPSFFMVKGR